MIFKIKKGCHYSNKWWHPLLTFNNSINGKFRLIGDCSYEKKQIDSNKIIGLSDNIHHHKDSIRIGWRYYKDKYEITCISYVKGIRKIDKITTVEKDSVNSFNIIIFDSCYVVTVNSSSKVVFRKSKYKFLRYVLKPYFGGTEKAPKDINIEIEGNFY